MENLRTPAGRARFVERVLRERSEFFGVEVADVQGRRRTKALVAARRDIAWVLAKEKFGIYEIARILGGRDYTTIYAYFRKRGWYEREKDGTPRSRVARNAGSELRGEQAAQRDHSADCS